MKPLNAYSMKNALCTSVHTLNLLQAYEEDSKRSDLSEPARQSLVTRHQLALVDCEDANNNTPLSEAAGGGHVDTIQLLIQRGADLNSRGRYQRVPLWRAAFGGHLQAVQVLIAFKECIPYFVW